MHQIVHISRRQVPMFTCTVFMYKLGDASIGCRVPDCPLLTQLWMRWTDPKKSRPAIHPFPVSILKCVVTCLWLAVSSKQRVKSSLEPAGIEQGSEEIKKKMQLEKHFIISCVRHSKIVLRFLNLKHWCYSEIISLSHSVKCGFSQLYAEELNE